MRSLAWFDINTFRPRKKWPPFCKRHFDMHFLAKMCFDGWYSDVISEILDGVLGIIFVFIPIVSVAIMYWLVSMTTTLPDDFKFCLVRSSMNNKGVTKAPYFNLTVRQIFILQNYLSPIYIWQVSPQLSCGHTRRIWTRYWIGSQFYDNGEKSGNNGTGELVQ